MEDVLIEMRSGMITKVKMPYGIRVKIIDHDIEMKEHAAPGDEVEIFENNNLIQDSMAILWTKQDIYGIAKELGIKIDDNIASSILRNLKKNHRPENGITKEMVQCYLQSLVF